MFKNGGLLRIVLELLTKLAFVSINSVKGFKSIFSTLCNIIYNGNKINVSSKVYETNKL